MKLFRKPNAPPAAARPAAAPNPSDALRELDPADRLALPDWQAALTADGIDVASITFVNDAVGARLGTPPASMESLALATVFAVAAQDLILVSPDPAGVRVVKRPIAEVQRLGQSPNGTYTDIIFNPLTGDQWRIRDPDEAIRRWFLSWGQLTP